ncbi:hypothetical protein [Haloimpatiens massiliensis]|uniref:hypothetical protein n=1 Tax=Haloimpatiens massiliensis TaxID=1658110 RepID=UPI000C8402BC|nr:hypothetical protein [Haloimpatiens massiliensis]
MSSSFKDNISETILEIVGATEADYYGTTSLEDINQKDASIYKVQYYKYSDYELIKCSFGAAINTEEYKNEKILIFSQEPEGVLEYNVAEIIEE